jgi:large subunit ribosomal protein L13
MGKHKPIYDRSQNLGDFVVVTNAEKVAFTGKKREQKVYRYHTGWPGGLVTTPLETMYEKKPEEVLRRAIAGMLPKNTLRRERLKLLRIFAGEKHPHSAEDLTPLPDNIVKVASPWLIVKERESVEVQTDNWCVCESACECVCASAFNRESETNFVNGYATARVRVIVFVIRM